jgi:outer membrane protein
MNLIKNSAIAISLLASILCLCLLVPLYNQKIVYVDSARLYGEFQLAKELNKEMEQLVKARTFFLDSTYRYIKSEVKRLDGTNKQDEKLTLERQMEDYSYKREAFEKEQLEENEKRQKKIWTQLNQYVQEYGAEKNYKLMFGAMGNGNIMYADKNYEITTDVINYINKKYSGQN